MKGETEGVAAAQGMPCVDCYANRSSGGGYGFTASGCCKRCGWPDPFREPDNA